ncbi:Hsp20 family protein [Orrella daihaiensis]|uniref:Hsp20 family protein n=1 Tax=Orrella daihaiensis TaxID=2782176 RepID=A0ABY4AK13_9BURK|nr:Hsp20 family protein [Orrella daihaiensis]UOD50529.1 Hsp20 family protein [Orrella daihaiensis]
MNYPFGRNILLSTVGFDRLLNAFNDLEKSVAETKSVTYPPYNILKMGEHDYAIEIAVAGFNSDEIDITVDNNKLTVTGKVAQTSDTEYLHRGIATRDFTREFTLAETVVVRSADMQNGLLVINLQNIVPEASKPKRIEIGARVEPRLVREPKAA